MAKPTITYGHGFMHDCDSTTGWVETEDGQTAALTTDGDVFKIDVTISAGNHIVYYTYDMPNISSTTYSKALFRYRTSSSHIKAKIELVFSDASTQTILAETDSTVWKEGTATITAAKTIDHVRLYANAYVGDVYYDFILLHKGTFTFPFVSDSEDLELENNIGYLKVPKRQGNITQNMGADSPFIRLSGIMDTASAWGTIPGAYLMTVWAKTDVWQWLTTDLGFNGKVTCPHLKISKVANMDGKRQFTFEMRKYDLIDGADWTSYEDWMGV